MSQGGPRAPTSLPWLLLLILVRVSGGAEDADGADVGVQKTAKEVYVYSGPINQQPTPISAGFQLLSTSDKTKRPPVSVTTTESPLAKEALIAFPPSVKVEARPNHASFVQFPSGDGAHTLISSSSTSKPNDVDYGATDILGEAIDQNAFGTTHIISECDGDECCPGPHCTKHLICHHGHDCYYVPHKKGSYHYSTHYHEGSSTSTSTSTSTPVRDPYHPIHRPYDPSPKPPPNMKPNRKAPPTKTKTSSHYTAKPSLHQGTYRPLPSHHLTVIKPAASNVALKTKKPTSLKSGFGTVGVATLIDEGVSSNTESRFGMKKRVGQRLKKKRFLKKYMMPLLMAYKMLFIVLVPVMVKTIMMVISASGLTGFFVALFGAAVTFHYYHLKLNASPTSITLSSPPPSTEATKVTKVIKYLPLPPQMMQHQQMIPLPHPHPPPPPHPEIPPPPQLPPLPPAPTYGPPQHHTPPPYPDEPYGGGFHYPNYQWMDKRRSKKRKKKKGSMLPSLSFLR